MKVEGGGEKEMMREAEGFYHIDLDYLIMVGELRQIS
jgi:hypothetical protein